MDFSCEPVFPSGVAEMLVCVLMHSASSTLWGQYPQRISAASPSQHKRGTFHPPSDHEGTAVERNRDIFERWKDRFSGNLVFNF